MRATVLRAGTLASRSSTENELMEYPVICVGVAPELTMVPPVDRMAMWGRCAMGKILSDALFGGSAGCDRLDAQRGGFLGKA